MLVRMIIPGLSRYEEIDDLTLAYFAGLFDGDGTIGGYQSTAKYTRGPKFRVQIYNSHRPVIEECKRLFGGFIRTHRVKLSKRDTFVWEISGSSGSARLLRSLRPHLRVKAVQADLALKAMSTYHGAGWPISDEIIAFRQWSLERIRELHVH